MRKTASCLVLFLLAGVLMAAPASAAYGTIVQLPADEMYSPYGGPATVTFTFAPDDPDTIFTVRLRRPGHGTIKERSYIVHPATDTSPHPVTFSWGELSVGAPTDYVVDVRRQDGGPVITGETFTLLPRLVDRLSSAPSPFYPLVQDGYKDHTTVGFSLAADTSDTVMHVFQDDAYGRCCGTEIRTVGLGPLPAGVQAWVWDGTRDDTSAAPKGTYFVRVGATDLDALSMLSKAQKVEITKGLIRKTASKEQPGRAYVRTAHERATARGGHCHVSRIGNSHEANIACANAEISVYWRWHLGPGERIESVSFVIDTGFYGCHKTLGHTATMSSIRVHSPPTSTCSVLSAKITYSYPVQA